jgi:glycosyltransferase involved in cell wall biosynthesis/predicted kinase
MIVELCGLPGAGKSTFARALESDGLFVRVRAGRRRDILWENARFLVRHPVTFLATLLWTVAHLSGGAKLKFINCFLVHNATYRRASRLPFAIIDQGYRQNVISLFGEQLASERLRAYLGTLPSPDLLVCFDIAPEVRAERLAARGYGTRDDMPEHKRVQWMAAAEENVRTLLGLLDDLPYPTTVVGEKGWEMLRLRLRHARVWRFVMNARMPTEKAHGLQIAKTMEALKRIGEFPLLVVPKRGNPIKERVAEYYALGSSIPIQRLRGVDALLWPIPAKVGFILNALIVFVAVAMGRLDPAGIFVTRSPELAWLLSRRGGTVLYEAHVLPSTKRWLYRALLSRVTMVVANSDGTAHAHRDAGISRVRTVRNGVDIGRFLSAPDRRDARTMLGLPADSFIAMYTGAFYEWKGVLVLLQAWNARFRNDPDAELVLVGGELRDLERMARGKLDLSPNVRLVPHEAASRIPAWLSAADVLVLPNIPSTMESIAYTSPIKVFEYLAAARPIVASDLPSVREILSEENAYLVKAGDAEALAEGIIRAKSDQDGAQARATKARSDAGLYSWNARAEMLVGIARKHPVPSSLKTR